MHSHLKERRDHPVLIAAAKLLWADKLTVASACPLDCEPAETEAGKPRESLPPRGARGETAGLGQPEGTLGPGQETGALKLPLWPHSRGGYLERRPTIYTCHTKLARALLHY